MSRDEVSADRLDAAIAMLEHLRRAGVYLSDAAGHRLTRGPFIAAVCQALEAVGKTTTPSRWGR